MTRRCSASQVGCCCRRKRLASRGALDEMAARTWGALSLSLAVERSGTGRFSISAQPITSTSSLEQLGELSSLLETVWRPSRPTCSCWGRMGERDSTLVESRMSDMREPYVWDPRDHVELTEEVNALLSRLRLQPASEAMRCFSDGSLHSRRRAIASTNRSVARVSGVDVLPAPNRGGPRGRLRVARSDFRRMFVVLSLVYSQPCSAHWRHMDSPSEEPRRPPNDGTATSRHCANQKPELITQR